MSKASHHYRFRPLMWTAIGLSFVAVAMATVLNLDPRIAGYVVGGLIVVCLAVCVFAYWLDARTGRVSRQMLDELSQRNAKGV